MIGEFIASLWTQSGSKKPMEDFMDWWSRYVTSRLLLALFIGLLIFSSFGQPIKCAAPSEYSAAWTEYTQRLCYLDGTYFVPLGAELFPDHNERNVRKYYPYIPIILLGASIVSLIPSMIWHYCNRACGLNGDEAVLIAQMVSEQSVETRHDGVEVIAFSISTALSRLRLRKTAFGGKRLAFFWLAMKMVTILLNARLLAILIIILGSNETFFGHDVVLEAFSTSYASESEHFPKMAMCDFRIVSLGNVVGHSVQCFLPANYYNGLIIASIWVWTLLIVIIGFGCLVYNAFVTLPPVLRGRQLKKIGSFSEESIKRIESFVDYLDLDGFLVLQMIAKNASTKVAEEVASVLWDYHRADLAPVDADEEEDQV